MIHSSSPVAASRKWLRMSAGLILVPGSRPCRMPPRASQIDSRTKPPPAVAIHAIKAAHSIASPPFADLLVPVGREYESSHQAVWKARSAAPAVRDRQAPVASEGLRAQLHAGRRLAALVLGAVDHREGVVDHVRIEAVRGQVLS